MKFEWELIGHNHDNLDMGMSTHRAKVFGGWLVLNKNYLIQQGVSISESIIFISDPEYKWIITEY